MLPFIRSSPISLRRICARMQAKFEGCSLRVCTSFWLFGLINNIYYVVILTAALDLVGPSIPKATVLLSCITPGLATKVITPYFIHLIPYSVRIPAFVALTTTGMLFVALSSDNVDTGKISSRLAGIILANISSGAGEVSFIAMTHYYGPFSIAAWGSGTGAAGLLGAAAYACATNTLGLSVRATLLCSLALSLVMLITYFGILPLDALQTAEMKDVDYRRLDTEDSVDTNPEEALASRPSSAIAREAPGVSVSTAYLRGHPGRLASLAFDLRDKVVRTRLLVVPYMLPLFLVYLAEYSINQGVAPTLLFPLDESPFKRFREFYPAYGTVYQLGVFISRSSLPFIRIRSLYFPSCLQIFNFAVLTAHAMSYFIPSVWIVFAIIFWEGLLGGLVYVSTFAAVREEVADAEREFSLGAVTLADSFGIFCAGIIGAILEPVLCDWQDHHGRDWCRQR